MSVELAPFCVSDLELLNVYQRYTPTVYAILRNAEEMSVVMETPFSWTMWSAYGVPLGCAGINPMNNEAWALLGDDMKRHMVLFSRKVRELGLDPYVKRCGPVLANVDRGHRVAYRWVRLLGFQPHDGTYWIYGASSHSR